MKSRSERRHLRRRTIAKWKRHYRNWGWYENRYGCIENEEQIELAARRKLQCSCWACGNPRRHFNEITLQEKKAIIDFVEQTSGISLRKPLYLQGINECKL